MKIFISTAVLEKALKTGKMFASPKAPKPILRNVLLRAEAGDRVTVASTDMEKTAKAFTTCAQVLEPGAALLPAGAVKAMEKIKSEYVTIDVTGNRTIIEAGSFKTMFYTEDVEEFPNLETETAPLFTTTGKDLARLARVGGFTDDDCGRYALGGVLLDMKEAGKVYTVATDGRRMGVQELTANIDENATQKIFILQGKPFEKAAKMLAKEANIRVLCSTKFIESVIFESDNFSISVPCLEGRFPEWRLGISQLVNPSISWMDRDTLLSLETFAESVTDGTNPGVVFERLDENTLDIWGVLGLNEGNTTAPAKLAPDFPQIKLNWNFLKDFLKVAPAGEMTVKTKDSRAGVLFETSDNFKYLVMPMHLDRKRPESMQEEKPEEKPTKKAPSKKAKKAPENDASTATATNTTPAHKATEKQAEGPLQGEEEKQGEKQEEKAPEQETTQEKRVKIAPVESSAPLATVTPAEPAEPAERPSVRASEPAPVESAPLATVPEPENRSAAADQNGPTAAEPVKAPTPTAAAEPEPVETAAADAEKAGWEIGTYTTKKGKIKTSIRFFQPPTTAQIEALKTAWYWEYNGTWNGSPRKLPEIFKH